MTDETPSEIAPVVPQVDHLADYRDDAKYKAKLPTQRTSLRRALNRISKLRRDDPTIPEAVQREIGDWDDQYGDVTPRRITDDLACRLLAFVRSESITPKEYLDIMKLILDQTDGPPKETMQQDVNLLAIKTIELPQDIAERV